MEQIPNNTRHELYNMFENELSLPIVWGCDDNELEEIVNSVSDTLIQFGYSNKVALAYITVAPLWIDAVHIWEYKRLTKNQDASLIPMSEIYEAVIYAQKEFNITDIERTELWELLALKSEKAMKVLHSFNLDSGE